MAFSQKSTTFAPAQTFSQMPAKRHDHKKKIKQRKSKNKLLPEQKSAAQPRVCEPIPDKLPYK